MLALQIARYENGRKHLSAFDMCKELTYMRKECEFEWLNEVSLHSLQQVCRDLEQAYKMYFKRSGKRPKFKKKKMRSISFPLAQSIHNTYFKNKNEFVTIKIKHIKCDHNYNIPIGRKDKGHNPICDPQIQYIKSSRKWILTFVMECEKQAPELIDESMGIDLGVKELAVVALGDKKIVFHNINKSKRMRQLEKKRKYIQRVIDRKYRTYNGFGTPKKGQTWEKSKNIEKYEQMLREIDAKMSNIRHNYIHQITRHLVNMLPKRVVMEDLNVSTMVKNKYLSKSISEQNFYFFIHTMKYKCEEYGIKFVQADRWFPSSKLCSYCGCKNTELTLNDREWTCQNCGMHHDRDYNAAINLMNYTEKISTTANNLVSTKLSA